MDEEGVQVITLPAGRQGKPARINIIRTFFERSNYFATLYQGSSNANGRNGFSGSTP
ncbi:MAG: hypothetical protein JRI64_03665 [Deltaproteobacteria bacterium]|nr:hypothetical protein [Deltaproteobacteria bacterium]